MLTTPSYVVSSDKKIQMYDGKTGLATMDVPNAHSMSIYYEQTLFMSSDPQINYAQVMKCLKPSHLY
jgi:hypothetical protein